MKKIIAVSVLALLSSGAFAGDIAAGKAKAAVCAGCHGMNGVSVAPTYPNLAGQKEAYLEKQLHAFKDGSRKDPIMSAMAAPLSEMDIENLADYFSSLPAGK